MAKNPKIHYTTAVYDKAADGNITVGTAVALADTGTVPPACTIVNVAVLTNTALTGASGGIDLLLNPTDASTDVKIVGAFAPGAVDVVKDTGLGATVKKESTFAIDAVGSNVTAGKLTFIIGYIL